MARFEHADDAELVRACVRGEAEAWEALVARYERLIYSISRAHRLTPDEADEVFQSVCLLLLTHLETLRDHSRLSAWIVTTTLRECWKIRRRAREYEDEADPSSLAHLPDPQLLPDEVIERIEQQHLIRQGLMRLPERCRRLLMLLFYEKRPYEEVSRELGLPRSSIGPIRARCLKRLKKVLESFGLFADQ